MILFFCISVILQLTMKDTEAIVLNKNGGLWFFEWTSNFGSETSCKPTKIMTNVSMVGTSSRTYTAVKTNGSIYSWPGDSNYFGGINQFVTRTADGYFEWKNQPLRIK